MVKINGINLKKITWEEDHEGIDISSGDIYLGTKKIGSYHQGFMDGMYHYEMNSKYDLEKLQRKIREIYSDREIYDLDCLIFDVLELMDREKEFKKVVKGGFNGMLHISDGYHAFYYQLSDETLKLSDEEIIERKRMNIDEYKKKTKFFKPTEFSPHKERVFRGVKSFELGKVIEIKDIEK